MFSLSLRLGGAVQILIRFPLFLFFFGRRSLAMTGVRKSTETRMGPNREQIVSYFTRLFFFILFFLDGLSWTGTVTHITLTFPMVHYANKKKKETFLFSISLWWYCDLLPAEETRTLHVIIQMRMRCHWIKQMGRYTRRARAWYYSRRQTQAASEMTLPTSLIRASSISKAKRFAGPGSIWWIDACYVFGFLYTLE